MLMVLLFAFLLNTINTLLAGGQFFVPLFPCFLFAHVSCSLQNKCLNTDIMFFFTRTNVMLSVQYCFDRIQSHVNVDMCIYLWFFDQSRCSQGCFTDHPLFGCSLRSSHCTQFLPPGQVLKLQFLSACITLFLYTPAFLVNLAVNSICTEILKIQLVSTRQDFLMIRQRILSYRHCGKTLFYSLSLNS